jgi:uncharacterized protein (DUF427 family)
MSDRVRLEPLAGTLHIRHGGELIAETSRAFVVFETGLPPRTYVPRADVRAELSEGRGAGTCPWKGQWRHLDVKSASGTIANGAWTYFETTAVCDPVKDFVSFYSEKFETSSEG